MMPIQPGARLGHYEIVSPLGAGGMGEVYAARDTKLRRNVALKLLPAAMAADPERRQRFEREAQAIAALNHPNIVTVYSVEESDGVHFLTMELVEGKTLAELLPRGGLPLDAWLKIAIPLADAVAAAHDKGIVHRDLKPANVMVSPGTLNGRIKILDFGLAKLRDEAPVAGGLGALPTEGLTGDGRVMGTVAYMSPEQAEGKPLDHRSDIFSLGIILYELATGERPFKGGTNVSVLSSILKDTPQSLSEVNPALPRELGRIVRHCLAKDPARRFQTAADLRNELEELKQDLDSGEVRKADVARAAATPAVKAGSRAWLLAGVVTLAVIAVAAAVFLWTRAAPPAAPVASAPIQFTVTQLTSQSGVEQFASLSPDGKWIVYSATTSGNADIYLQSVGGQTPINLTKDSPAADTQPAFSPDGEEIAFRSEREGGGLFVMGRTGESARRITAAGFNPAWSPDGKELAYGLQSIAFNPFGRAGAVELWAVKVARGETRRVAGRDAVQPSWSPHGQRIAYWGMVEKEASQRDIWTIPATGGEPMAVTHDAALDWNPVWAPDGRYLYFSSNRSGSLNLWRVPIDEATGKPLGPLEPITTPAAAVGHLSVSADGRRLAYTALVQSDHVHRVAFEPGSGTVTGDPQPITSGTRRWGLQGGADVSLDGEWLAFQSTPVEDVYVARADGSSLRQLTNDQANDRIVRWAPDGTRVAFHSNRGGKYDVWAIRPDGSGLQQLTDVPNGIQYVVWSPDGRQMLTMERVTGNLLVFDTEKPWASQTPRVIKSPTGGEALIPMSWSPDGRFVAFSGFAGSGFGLMLYGFAQGSFDKLTEPGAGRGGGGTTAAWLNDSRRLVYAANGRLLLLDTESKKTRELLSIRSENLANPRLSRDNRYLYFTRSSSEGDVWLLTMK